MFSFRSLSGKALLLTTLLLEFVAAAWGSTTASIYGTVKDPSGAVIQKAIVTALNIKTGVRLTVPVGSGGTFSFLSLPVGQYELEVKAPGFRTYTQTGINVDANDALRLNVILQLGAVTESINVAASTVHVETVSNQMGDVIGSNKMLDLPLNGRNYIDLLGLQTGIVPVSTNGSVAFGSSSGGQSTGNISINGQRETSNGFEVNGGNVTEALGNGAGALPELDSIAEFRVVTSNADAEYGEYNGGRVSVITKSGTNEWHGSAFEFLRNAVLDARNYFDSDAINAVTGTELPKEELVRNQFGGTFGGPVKHNKVFFFADYEGTRQVAAQNTGLVPVPSQAERNGNFSADPSVLTGTVGGGLAAPYFASVLSQRLGYTVTSGEPYYTPGCSTSSCVFPNGIIPPAAFSSAAKGLLGFIPLPNLIGPQGTFFISSADDVRTREDKGGGRLDVESRWGRLTAYYFYDGVTNLKPFGDNLVPGFPSKNGGSTSQVNLSDTKTFGTTAVNELRFNLLRYVALSDTPTQGLGIDLADYGFKVGVPGGLIPANPATEAIPTVGIAGGPTIGVPVVTYNRYQTSPQVLDTFSKVVGSHSFIFGGQYHRTNFTELFPIIISNGDFYFSGIETGTGFADYLIGAVAPGSFIQESPVALHDRKNYAGFFAQDSWHARQNLTVNYGVRWDLIQPWYELNNQKNTYVLGGQSTVFPTAPRGDLFVGDPLPGGGTVSRSVAQFPKNNLGPRIGIAYSPSVGSGFWRKIVGSSGNTSIRAAYGMYYTNIEGLNLINTQPEPPFLFYYTAPEPPFFEAPLTNRTDGAINSVPLPFHPPTPGQRIDFSQFYPLTGEPAVSIKARTPYTENYTFGLQRQIRAKTLLSLTYVGNQGHKLLALADANPGDPQLCLSLPGCGPGGELGTYTNAQGQTVVGTRGPFGYPFGEIPLVNTMGTSSYNSLQAEVRYSSGRLSFLAGYTYSKSLTDSWGVWNIIPMNPLNHSLSRGLSPSDVTNNFVVSYSIHLPFDLLTRNRLISGWKLSGITHFATGIPVLIAEDDDRSLLGSVDQPNFAGGNLHITDPRTRLPYFDPSLFSLEQLGQFGNTRPYFFHGPGINNFDMGLLNDIRLTEKLTLQFRAEFFNIFNHAQFFAPDGLINDGLPSEGGTFGLVTTARDPRIGQIALKLSF